MKFKLPHVSLKFALSTVLSLVAVYFIYVAVIGCVASTDSQRFEVEIPEQELTDQDKAMIMANAVTQSLELQLNSVEGWVPNDLFAVPWFLDNISNYQRGVIYATRPASDVVTKAISRFGTNDTIDKRLSNASFQEFVYGPDIWGFFVQSSEAQYEKGIRNWKAWAASVGTSAKNAGIYNVKSDDVYQILQYCHDMLEYSVGLLNNQKIGHFESDNIVYYTKGICSVVDNVLRGLIAVDSSVVERGGTENTEIALKRLSYVAEFDPLYVVAGGNEVGDSMLPNHVATLARHIDVASNRINDMMKTMEK